MYETPTMCQAILDSEILPPRENPYPFGTCVPLHEMNRNKETNKSIHYKVLLGLWR